MPTPEAMPLAPRHTTSSKLARPGTTTSSPWPQYLVQGIFGPEGSSSARPTTGRPGPPPVPELRGLKSLAAAAASMAGAAAHAGPSSASPAKHSVSGQIYGTAGGGSQSARDSRPAPSSYSGGGASSLLGASGPLPHGPGGRIPVRLAQTARDHVGGILPLEHEAPRMADLQGQVRRHLASRGEFRHAGPAQVHSSVDRATMRLIADAGDGMKALTGSLVSGPPHAPHGPAGFSASGPLTAFARRPPLPPRGQPLGGAAGGGGEVKEGLSASSSSPAPFSATPRPIRSQPSPAAPASLAPARLGPTPEEEPGAGAGSEGAASVSASSFAPLNARPHANSQGLRDEFARRLARLMNPRSAEEERAAAAEAADRRQVRDPQVVLAAYAAACSRSGVAPNTALLQQIAARRYLGSSWDFTGFYLGQHGVWPLFELLSFCSRLRSLSLAGVGLHNDAVPALCHLAREHLTQLRRLDLSNNPLSGESGLALLVLRAAHPTLEFVRAADTRIDPQVQQQLLTRDISEADRVHARDLVRQQRREERAAARAARMLERRVRAQAERRRVAEEQGVEFDEESDAAMEAAGVFEDDDSAASDGDKSRSDSGDSRSGDEDPAVSAILQVASRVAKRTAGVALVDTTRRATTRRWAASAAREAARGRARAA